MYARKDYFNSYNVLRILIKELNIHVTSFTVAKELENHEEPTSLLALSDCLTLWNIPNIAYRVSKDNFDPKRMKFPFIVPLKGNPDVFNVIHAIENDQVTYSKSKKINGTISLEEFLKRWDGVFLYAESEQESGEKQFHLSIIKGWIYQVRLPFWSCYI